MSHRPGTTFSRFDGSVGILQRVLTDYRAPLFERIADRCAHLSIFAGFADEAERIRSAQQVFGATIVTARNRQILHGPLHLLQQGQRPHHQLRT